MDIFSKKTYIAIVLVTCTLAFAIGVYKTLQGNRYVSPRPPLPIPASLNNPPRANDSALDTEIDVQKKPITLRGDEKLVIENRHYLVGETITLKDNATLIVRNSTFEHKSTLGKKITLNAYGKSKVILENSILAVSCDEIVSWNFTDDASLVAHGIQKDVTGCFPHQSFFNATHAEITSWDGADITICDSAKVSVQDSKNLLADLCFPANARIDEVLPKQTTAAYIFPNKNDSGISFLLSLSNTSVDMWNVRVVPGADITIRDSGAIQVGIHAQKPWEQKTVSFDGLKNEMFEDHAWKFVDAKLHLINTSVRAWNFFFEHTNKLRLRNSTVHKLTVSEDSVAILEQSTVDTTKTKDFAEVTFQESRLTDTATSFDTSKITFVDSSIGTPVEGGTLHATDKSVITLVHTVSNATMFEEAKGKIVVQ